MLLVNCVANPGKATWLTLWSWDGTRWEKVTQDGPPGCILGGAAYDDLMDVLVLSEDGRWKELSPPISLSSNRMRMIKRDRVALGLSYSKSERYNHAWLSFL